MGDQKQARRRISDTSKARKICTARSKGDSTNAPDFGQLQLEAALSTALALRLGSDRYP